ncbi:MAG: PD-(D/E)XK nuclease family protein, partial [archaeon]
MIYSHSRLETFKNCPKKFFFGYIEKPDIKIKKGIEAFLGTMVHETLEKLYKDLRFSKINSLDELINFYKVTWNENYKPQEIEIVRKNYTEDNYKEMGVNFITDYYAMYAPFNQSKTLG